MRRSGRDYAKSEAKPSHLGLAERSSMWNKNRLSRLVTARKPWARSSKDLPMSLLKWALIFFLISVVAAIFGFTGISAATADIARILFYIFVVIFLVLLVLALVVFR
jgi:uncharacterized membrane protein YtjA (UPF0391 family)